MESISYAGMQPSDGKRNGCKKCRKGCKRGLHPEGTCVEAVSNGVCFFPFVSPGVLLRGMRHSHGVARWFMDMRSLWMIYSPVIAVS